MKRSLEPYLWWPPDVIHHGFNRQKERVLVIPLRLILAHSGSILILISRLIKVWLGIQDQALDRHKNLKHRRHTRKPLLISSAIPGVKQTKTYFPTVIQIRVKSKTSRMVMYFLCLRDHYVYQKHNHRVVMTTKE